MSVERFGKYEVNDLIGQGGFGRVYRAYDPALKRHVAIKTCAVADTGMRARFAREAEIAASLSHPYIVTVHDYGHHDGEPYLVQEFLEGEDLDHKLKRGESLALERVTGWLLQIAEALEYAHGRGVLHRDIKPANIRVLPNGELRIMDFGIAKLLDAEQNLTRTGMSIGTGGYLAPEQLRGDRVDQRADMFAFGVTAYELVTGARAFDADSFTSMMFRVAHEEPTPLQQLAPTCDPRLAALIERCLRKQADDRYTDFGEIATALSGIRGTSGPDAAPIEHRGAAVQSDPRRDPSRQKSPPTPASLPPYPRPRPALASHARRPMFPKRWASLAAWGLVAATIAVAVFGVLNLPERSRSDSASSDGEVAPTSTTLPASETAAAAQAGEASRALRRARSMAASAGAGGTVEVGPAATTRSTGAAPLGAASESESRTAGPRDSPSEGVPALDVGHVLVAVSSQAPEPRDAVESTLISELMKAGYSVSDVAATTGMITALAGGDTDEIAGTGAGGVIVVDVSADARPLVPGMFSGSAAVTLKVYATSGARLLASERFEIGTAQVPAEPGPTAAAAAAAAAHAAAYQSARAAVRHLDRLRSG